MKICNICKIEKDEACFYKRTASKDGLSLKCKSCCKKYDKQYQQDNKCAICNTEFENIIEKPGKVKVGYNVDHDHTTGSVRGLLCSKCNRSIGLLQDSIEVLESAVKYLKKYKEEPTHETENS